MCRIESCENYSMCVRSSSDLPDILPQVESRENPSLCGVPCAVVQYKAWKGGGIIAVNYEARAQGVGRQMRGDDAREKCPEIVLVRVPESRDKADLTKYRRAGREVIEVLLASGATVERASIDEAYLDLTKLVEERLREGRKVTPEQVANTHLGGGKGEGRGEMMRAWLEEAQEEGASPGDVRLALGAVLVEELRQEVFKVTGFRCSAGIAHCKTLAKLCAGQNKPNGQTVLPQSCVPELYRTLSLTKVRGLGGKLGEEVVERLGVTTMGQVAGLPLSTLSAALDPKTAAWLHKLAAEGQDGEEVTVRELPKSIGCGKNFRGPDMLDTREKVEMRLLALVEELVERVEVDRAEYGRVARGLTVGVGLEQEGRPALLKGVPTHQVSRAGQLRGYSVDLVYREAFSLLLKLNTSTSNSWCPRICNLSLCATKFEDSSATTTKSITSFFAKAVEGTQPSQSVGEPSKTVESAPALEDVAASEKPISSFFSKSVQGDKTANKEPIEEEASVVRIEDTRQVTQRTPFFTAIMAKPVQVEKEEVSPISCGLEASLFATVENADKTTKEVSDVDVREDEKEDGRDNREKQEDEEDADGISVEELIPSLDQFDPSILPLLPLPLRARAKERLRLLQEQQVKIKKGGISKFLVKKPNPVEEENTDVETNGDIDVLHDITLEGNCDEGLIPRGENVVSDEDMVQCEQCAKKISPFDLPEHLDFHFASSLVEPRQILNSNQKPKPEPVSGKRKRKNEKDGGASKRSSGNISSFFTKS